MRNPLLRTLEDCVSPSAARLRGQIESAGTAQELWMLRLDAFQIISQRHDQRIATERIDALKSSFEGWLDPRQLTRVR